MAKYKIDTNSYLNPDGTKITHSMLTNYDKVIGITSMMTLNKIGNKSITIAIKDLTLKSVVINIPLDAFNHLCNTIKDQSEVGPMTSSTGS